MSSSTVSIEAEREESEALLPGADLWVVADLERSSWSQKIDWYLNFQLLRSQTHKTAAPGQELKQVLSRWEIQVPAPDDLSTTPLMVVSSDSLPNHAVVLVPFDDAEARAWPQKVHEVWSRLDSPSLRVFLPVGMDAARFIKAWPGPEDALAHAVVAEPS